LGYGHLAPLGFKYLVRGLGYGHLAPLSKERDT
jgi:hypothetical protein